MTTNTAGYTMVGMKESESTKTYTADVRQTSGSQLGATASAMADEGFSEPRGAGRTPPPG
jgi:hypothetical protein